MHRLIASVALIVNQLNTSFCFVPGMPLNVISSLPPLARILGETWSSSSDARKINLFLFGVKSVNYDINCTLFRKVQTFIINTNRFSMATV